MKLTEKKNTKHTSQNRIFTTCFSIFMASCVRFVYTAPFFCFCSLFSYLQFLICMWNETKCTHQRQRIHTATHAYRQCKTIVHKNVAYGLLWTHRLPLHASVSGIFLIQCFFLSFSKSRFVVSP